MKVKSLYPPVLSTLSTLLCIIPFFLASGNTSAAAPSSAPMSISGSGPEAEDPAYRAYFGRISQALVNEKRKVAFYYYDIENGYTVTHLENQIFPAASIAKAPYSRFILSNPDNDCSKELTYQLKNQRAGAGILQDSKPGVSYEISYLFKLILTISDNSAYNMLVNHYKTYGFNDYANNLGIRNHRISPDNKFGDMSVKDACIYFLDIYRWFEDGSSRAQDVNRWMCQSAEHRQIREYLDVPVAEKYGRDEECGAFHAAGIVYDRHPYILCIFTDASAPDDSPELARMQDLYNVIVTNIHQIHTTRYGLDTAADKVQLRAGLRQTALKKRPAKNPAGLLTK